MTIFLILAPYGAFATLMLVSPAVISLFASAAIGLLVTAYDAFRGRSIKVLGAGSVILFAALGAYITLVDRGLSSSAVKLTIDAGVFALSPTPVRIRKPFPPQYARRAGTAGTAQLTGFSPPTSII